jgi:hypothetical protein
VAGPPALFEKRTLLGFLLLLLTDADLEHLLLCFLVGFVVVTSHSLIQILVDVGVFRKHRHHSEILVAGRAKWPKASHVRNCHVVNYSSYALFVYKADP